MSIHIHTWLAFTEDTTDLIARLLFEKRFGCAPAEVQRSPGLVLAGPCPEAPQVEPEPEYGFGANELDDDGMGYVDDDDTDEDSNECGLFVDGGVYVCSAVGSEECDFECPHNGLIGTRPEVIDIEL